MTKQEFLTKAKKIYRDHLDNLSTAGDYTPEMNFIYSNDLILRVFVSYEDTTIGTVTSINHRWCTARNMDDMKESDRLKEDAAQEENDFKAMGLLNKSLREGRHERFTESALPQLLRMGYDVADDGNNKYTIDTDSQSEKYGVIDYFPKANKLLIRKENRWVKPGLAWIVEHLLK
jgi:hypothetical protein